MANSADHLAVLQNIETEVGPITRPYAKIYQLTITQLNTVQQSILGLEHSANTGVLPQWRLIETQTKFFDAGDRLATLAPHIKNFSANEKLKMNALFEMSNTINAKLIQVHERREAVADKLSTAHALPEDSPAPQSAILTEITAAEKEKQIIAKVTQGRTLAMAERVKKSKSTSPGEGYSHSSLRTQQQSAPLRGLQADRMTNVIKMVKEKEEKKLADTMNQYQDLKEAETVAEKKQAFADAVKQSLEADETYDPVIAEKTKLTTELKQLKAEMSAKAAGKAVEQDDFFDAAIKKHESNGDEELEAFDEVSDKVINTPANHDVFSYSWDLAKPLSEVPKDEDNDSLAVMDGEEEIGGANLRQIEAFGDEHDYSAFNCDSGHRGNPVLKSEGDSGEENPDKEPAKELDEENLVENSKGSGEEVDEESDDEVEDSDEEVDEESDEDSSDQDSAKAVFEEVDLSGEEEINREGETDIDDDGFVLVDADEAAGAPEQPWSPNERTRARACVVM